MSTRAGGSTRGGGDGLHNEDFFTIDEGLGLFIVCDGEGILPGGEVASQVAAEAVEEFVSKSSAQFEDEGETGLRRIMARAMQFSFAALDDVEDIRPDLSGLETTLSAVLVRNRTAVAAHRGDSRVYLIRDGRARQLTLDHELTEELGLRGEGDGFEVFGFDLEGGDCIVLCTDGAETALQNRDLVRSASERPPNVLASRIVSAAHRENDAQDATAVVIRVSGPHEPSYLSLSHAPQGTRYGHLVVPA